MSHIITKKYGCFPKVHCLDHGFVKLIDCMPAVLPDGEDSADYAIAEAARCSYQRGTKSINDDKALIRYLIRHNHSSPLEMVEFKFHLKMPLFVARQWLRHRTASLNELSGRYSEMPDEYYIPPLDEMRTQGITNKQGSESSLVDNPQDVAGTLQQSCSDSFTNYEKCLDSGLARELSRVILPLSTYTELYWKIDLKNLLHLLNLRCDSHAQKEIRVFADAILELITPIVPHTIEAWNDYSEYRGAMKFTAAELTALKACLDTKTELPALNSTSKTEQIEWRQKLNRLLNS